MKSLLSYDVGIAVMRPELFYGFLVSLVNQTILPASVIICDNGEIPLTKTYSLRFMIDTLEIKNIKVKYIRNKKNTAIGYSRLLLAREASSSIIAFADDDVFWERDTAEILLKTFCSQKLKFVVPLVFTANAECGLPNFIAVIEKDKHRQFSLQSKKKIIATEDANGCTMFINREEFLKNSLLVKLLTNWGKNMSLDDRLIMRLLKVGAINQKACVWHLLSSSNRNIPLMGFNAVENKFLDLITK